MTLNYKYSVKIPDITLPLLFLGKLSRDMQKNTKLPKVNWWFYSRLEESFLQKFPAHKNDYLIYMTNEEKKDVVNFTELFQRHALASYVRMYCMPDAMY